MYNCQTWDIAKAYFGDRQKTVYPNEKNNLTEIELTYPTVTFRLKI